VGSASQQRKQAGKGKGPWLEGKCRLTLGVIRSREKLGKSIKGEGAAGGNFKLRTGKSR